MFVRLAECFVSLAQTFGDIAEMFVRAEACLKFILKKVVAIPANGL